MKKFATPGTKWTHTIEYRVTSKTLGDVTGAGARYSDTMCELVAVKDVQNRVIDVGHTRIESLRTPLLSSARAATNELMARQFFTALRQRGQIVLREVRLPAKNTSALGPGARATATTTATAATTAATTATAAPTAAPTAASRSVQQVDLEDDFNPADQVDQNDAVLMANLAALQQDMQATGSWDD